MLLCPPTLHHAMIVLMLSQTQKHEHMYTHPTPLLTLSKLSLSSMVLIVTLLRPSLVFTRSNSSFSFRRPWC